MYKFNIFHGFFAVIICVFSTNGFPASAPFEQVINQTTGTEDIVSNKSDITKETELSSRISVLRINYAKAFNDQVHKNWDTKHIPKEFKCKVEFTQAPGGIVIDVIFLDCPSNSSARNSVELALRIEPLPYRGFEEVFNRRHTTTFCTLCEESRPRTETSLQQPIDSTRLADDVAQKSADFTKLIIDIRKRNPNHLSPLFTTGKSGEFSEYVMDCLNKIALRSSSNTRISHNIPSGASISFHLLLSPDGTVNAIQILSNGGGPDLESMLRDAIRLAAPFPKFTDAMATKHSAVIITHTVGYDDCQSLSSDCTMGR